MLQHDTGDGGAAAALSELLIERCQIGGSDPLPLEAGTPGYSTPEQTRPGRGPLEVFGLSRAEHERVSCGQPAEVTARGSSDACLSARFYAHARFEFPF